MVAVAVVAALASSAISAYSAHQQGKAAEQMHKYNAELAAREAQAVDEASDRDERQSRVEARQLRARQFLQFAKGGVMPGSGTPLLIQQETAAEQEKDIAVQRYKYAQQYSRHMGESSLQKMMGKSKSRAGRWQAGSSMLSGVSRAAALSAEYG